jgi:vitamin B12 transporter
MSVKRIYAAQPIVFGAALSLFAASTALADDELESVVVTAARVAQPISQVIGSVTVIDRAEIEKRQVQSLQDLLRGEAGIDIINTGGLGKPSSIFLRGGNASQTLILVDGVRVGSATLGITSIELIPVDQIERVEIVRGPRSSLYGSDAMGGVIQIFTRKNNGLNASVGAGSYNTQKYSAGFGMQSDSLRFSVNGGYIQTDGFNACNNSIGCFVNEPDDDGYRNSSVSAELGYAFGKIADLELRTLYTQGFTQSDGFDINENRFRNSAPSVRLRITPIDALAVTLSGGITQDDSTGYKNSAYNSQFDTEKRNAAAQIDWHAGNQNFTMGGDYLNDVIASNNNFVATERDNLGVFAQYLGKLGQHELSASVRHDDNEQFGTYNTGNLGWKWFVLDRALTLNAGWGKAFHAPSFNDLYYPLDQFGSFGNPNLMPERSRSIEFGAGGSYSWFSWSVQAFQTKTQDLIDWTCDPITFACSPSNVSEARVQGVEVTAGGRWDKLKADLTYTAQDPRSRAEGANYDHYLARRSRQAGRLDVGYDFGQAQIGSTINVAGKRYDNIANTTVLPGYTTVDFKANIDLCKTLALQVKLGNFFDRQYETARYFAQEGRTVFVTLRYQAK